MHIVTLTTTISSTCSKCGIVKKSGKMSCCGIGGSWFGNCGSASDTNTEHTWHEGLQACKAQAQSKTVISQELSDVSQERNASSSGVDAANSKSVAMAAKSAASASSRMAGAPPTVVSANISTAYATSTMNYERLVAAITTRTSAPLNMTTLTAIMTTVEASMATSTHLTMMHNSANTFSSASVRAAVTSRAASTSQLDIAIFTSFLFAVAVCSCSPSILFVWTISVTVKEAEHKYHAGSNGCPRFYELANDNILDLDFINLSDDDLRIRWSRMNSRGLMQIKPI